MKWKSIILIFLLLSNLQAYHLRMKKSHHSYLSTLQRLMYILKKDGFIIHKSIVYSRYLKKGKKGVLISFSHPAITALLVNQDPRCGLDMPFRILILKNGRSVFLLYHAPLELYENYHINRHTIHKLSRLINQIVQTATQ